MDRPGTVHPPRKPPVLDAPESDPGIGRAYVRVVVVWLAVLAGLWWLQHAFI